MTLLSIVQSAADRLGLPQPASVAANTSLAALRLYKLCNQAGVALARRHDWTILIKEKTFTTVATETQTDTPIPTDWDRFVEEAFWNRTLSERVFGPLNSTEWQRRKAAVSTGIHSYFRVRGGLMLFNPVPTAGQTCAYEYVSKYWVDTAGGSTWNAAAFAGDDDTTALDEECITLGLVWRYKRSVGLDYAEEFRDYELMVENRVGNDGGRRTIDMTPSMEDQLIPNIPESGWSL